jgi:hypothetical protein
MYQPSNLTISGFQRCCTEGQQGAAADRRRSEARGVGDEVDRCGHDDFLASHLCVCELSCLPILAGVRSCGVNTTRWTDDLWNQLLLLSA